MIIAVNHAGVPAPINEIRTFFDGFILEDCAHSCYTPGAGQQGDIAVWSFQAVKTMPCGDGGMITTNNKKIYEKIEAGNLLQIYFYNVPDKTERKEEEEDIIRKIDPWWNDTYNGT